MKTIHNWLVSYLHSEPVTTYTLSLYCLNCHHFQDIEIPKGKEANSYIHTIRIVCNHCGVANKIKVAEFQ